MVIMWTWVGEENLKWKQPTALGRAGNILLNTRKIGSTPANKPEGNVQGKENTELGFMAL